MVKRSLPSYLGGRNDAPKKRKINIVDRMIPSYREDTLSNPVFMFLAEECTAQKNRNDRLALRSAKYVADAAIERATYEVEIEHLRATIATHQATTDATLRYSAAVENEREAMQDAMTNFLAVYVTDMGHADFIELWRSAKIQWNVTSNAFDDFDDNLTQEDDDSEVEVVDLTDDDDALV